MTDTSSSIRPTALVVLDEKKIGEITLYLSVRPYRPRSWIASTTIPVPIAIIRMSPATRT